MSPKEGSRIPTPTDVVKISPDKKVNRRRGRLLAPILLGTALALGGGERNGTNALANDQRSESTHLLENADLPQRIGDLEIFDLAVDPRTGKPLAEQDWMKGIISAERKRLYGDGVDYIQQESLDPFNLEQVELSSDHLRIIKEIEDLTGMKVSLPKNPTQIPGDAGRMGIKENVSLTTVQLQKILEAFERNPAKYLEKKYAGGKLGITTEILFIISGAVGVGGLNSHWTFSDGHSGFIATVLYPSGIEFDLPLTPKYPYLDVHGERLLYVVGHEVNGHTLNRYGNPQYNRYLEDVGWIEQRLLPPGREGEDFRGKKSADEAFSDMWGFLFANPEAFLAFVQLNPYTARHIVKETIREDGNYKGWSVLFDGGKIQDAVERIRADIYLEYESAPTPESFTVFLPISHTGERVNATPEPEGGFGRGSNLSDARRFIPNYENRRNNRKGR